MNQQDLLYNIMLQLPLDDIKSLCVTQQIGNKICNLKQFWYDKMIKDDILLGNDYSLERYALLLKLKDKASNDLATDHYILPAKGGSPIPKYIPTALLPLKLRNKIPEDEIYHLKVSKMMDRYVLTTTTNSGSYGAVISLDEMLYLLFTLYDFEHQRDIQYSINKKLKKELYKSREADYIKGLIDSDEFEFSDSSVDI